MTFCMQRYIIFCILCLFVLACGKKRCAVRSEIAQVPLKLNYSALSSSFFSVSSEDSMQAWLQSRYRFMQPYYASEWSNSVALAQALFQVIQHPSMDTVYTEVQQSFDQDNLRRAFMDAFKHVRFYFKDFTVPEIATFTSGLYRDIMLTDSLWLISLDWFIGTQATYRPLQVPGYILERYTPAHVLPACMLWLSIAFSQNDVGDRTLLADMIAAGKSIAFARSVLPCTPIHTILGYNQAQYQDICTHEAVIWSYFTHNKLLYETSPLQKRKFMDERPGIPEIGPRCPGRIGRWLGWRIIQSYMSHHSNISISEIMRSKDIQKLLKESRYAPKAS